jgi:hypothetical protein
MTLPTTALAASPSVFEVTATSEFYCDLGKIYAVRTLDGVYIKVLNYHPPGKGLNTGKQPVLLFPGILANINEFLSRSTSRVRQFYTVTLPDNLADWAKDDENIKNDPLLYYSIAYYLWKQGYDVWLANYRGVGYAEMKSGFGSSRTSLDVFALYDARAALGLVYDKTGKHPVVGGHSTGGLVTMMLLQGTYFYGGEVYSSDSLVKERNGIVSGRETIKGFIALEPAGIPTVTELLNTYLGWLLLDTGLFIDIRAMLEALDGTGQCSLIYLLNEVLAQFGPYIKDIVENILNMDLTDLTPALGYYHMLYSFDGLYFDTIAQYSDFAFNRVIREYFKNGWLNQYREVPPTPIPGWDGYYYYTGKNMKKMRVPIIAVLATHQNNYLDLVNATEIIEDFIKGKTPTIYDTYCWVEGAHVDAPTGIRAPIQAFPKIGSWLSQVAPA